MRFATLQTGDWEKVAPYVDTLCLPVYNLSLTEKKLGLSKGKMIEFLVESLEKKLAGRLLLLPSVSFTGDSGERLQAYLEDVLQGFDSSGFNYVSLVTDQDIRLDMIESQVTFKLHQHILQTEDITDVEAIDREVEEFYQEILDLWVKKA